MDQPLETEEESAPISYGDMRITTDRRIGPCLFWVVPDVSAGFNVPAFYAQFFAQRPDDAERPPPAASSRGPE